MTPQELKALDRRLSSFLEDLLAPMGRSERRHWARTYVEGLLLDGERKWIEPMASRLSGVDVQALRQFVGQDSLDGGGNPAPVGTESGGPDQFPGGVDSG